MAKYNSLIPGVEIENIAEDFKNALKIEQYRLGKQALYFPAGLRWAYLLKTAVGSFQFNLEKPANMQKVLDSIGK